MSTVKDTLIQALKDPSLNDAARKTLVEALIALESPAVSATVDAPAPRSAAPTERKTLTKTAVNALPLPAAGERLVWDTITPQLAVRLRPSGRSWIVIVWDRERRRKTTRTLGKCSAMTPEQARAHAQRFVGRVADGEDIRRVREDGMTVRHLIEAWHKEKSGTARTAGELHDKMLTYLGKMAERPAQEIVREDIGLIHHKIATEARKRVYRTINGVKNCAVETGDPGLPATADKWRAALSSVFSWAMSKGLAATNPCEGIQHAFDAKNAARTNYLRGDELLRFWKALEQDQDPDSRDAIKLLLFTGQRRGNVLEMRWADVDLAQGVWSLSAKQTKQKKAQTTPLVSQAREILQGRWGTSANPYVFPATRASSTDDKPRPMSETKLRDAWARICRVANIPDLRPHDLRHTAGSWLARLGANEAIRQKALGHQTPAMAARYSHLELDPVADAMQRVAHAIEAEATKPAATVRTFKTRNPSAG